MHHVLIIEAGCTYYYYLFKYNNYQLTEIRNENAYTYALLLKIEQFIRGTLIQVSTTRSLSMLFDEQDH